MGEFIGVIQGDTIVQTIAQRAWDLWYYRMVGSCRMCGINSTC